MNTVLEINSYSKVPKYKQVVDTIISDIHGGKFRKGQKIPSINETSFEYLLSRDTVEKAYNELRNKGVIVSVRGKGFYVSNTQNIGKKRILLLFNKISNYHKLIYTQLVEKLQENAVVDLQFHNSNLSQMNELIEEGFSGYYRVVLFPQFNAENREIVRTLSKIPSEKLILVNYNIEGLPGKHAAIYQDFANDIYQALQATGEDLRKYDKFNLVFPNRESLMHSPEIITGFRDFCFHNKYNFAISNGFDKSFVQKNNAYLVVLDEDLIQLIKIAKAKGLKVGKDIGIISYDESPMKEVLCNGIDVVSTDFSSMSGEITKMILENSFEKKSNRFTYIRRNSL